ncbi:DegT/DnrJ/EryC1/StrS family aminotransferase [Mycolicibacterium pulveris]|uniref:8-amino-3,8-dideoxy-alpha-D-manno-octulosonate transaminase n=1 Tax=Mycolicibacterium pulveris TaxID=36813 RepID=A0A7I7UJH3_MYCPV|nr:DegT/DnrJ/EryC1/StrS family aminotransferase [Mycolicibacterium pulveris]MCV6979534.1 DegT/DnrJ/EryC1/StrS family aminotransferase [Mycolicibacterium pulveris]BBY81021.1 8-amino-3,8-dideoxy-alpha-D-manno-octulosonate transaminase [Mycolicibacterium pulveris]
MTSTTTAHDEASALAIDGGPPVRSRPLPWEFPGGNRIGTEELELINRVVKAQSPFRFYGPDLQHMVDTFEREWCEKFGHRHALGVSSGTAALSIVMGALGVGPGDEVLVPGLLWVSCISAVVRAGAIPRLVDIDETFCINPDDLERKIGPRTRAVLCVHISGAPGDLTRISGICRSRGVALIEDCAQAAGASQYGRAVGTFGDIGIFSMQLNKTITSGEGGVVVTQRDDLFRRAVAMHDLGYARDDDGRIDTSDESCQLWGIGARMSELAGALGLAQLRKIPDIVSSMRDAKWRIRRALEGTDGLEFRDIIDPSGDSGLVLIFTLPDEPTCRRFIDALRAEGISGPSGSLAVVTMQEWGLHWYCNIPSLVHKRSNSRDGAPWTHPANAFAADYEYAAGALPGCDDLRSRGALLSIGSTYAEADIDDIVAAFRKVARELL